MKRISNLSLACTEADKVAAERCRKMAGPFPPSTSLLLLLCVRHSLASLLKGDLTLQALSSRYSHVDLDAIGTRAEAR